MEQVVIKAAEEEDEAAAQLGGGGVEREVCRGFPLVCICIFFKCIKQIMCLFWADFYLFRQWLFFGVIPNKEKQILQNSLIYGFLVSPLTNYSLQILILNWNLPRGKWVLQKLTVIAFYYY